MKKLVLSVCVLMFSLGITSAQKSVQLPKPDLSMKVSLMEALSQRKSVREYGARELSLQELSNLLWAANGVNRPDGKRTAPSAMDKRDVEIYVCKKDGVYRYDAVKNELEFLTSQDLRKSIAGRQTFAATAPVTLVLVSDLNKLGGASAETIGAMDAGYVSQNVCLYCSAAGLVTVPRASMDTEEFIRVLNLPKGMKPMLNHPVGFPK